MDVTLSYGGLEICVNIPDGVSVDEYSPEAVTKKIDFNQFCSEFQPAGGAKFLTAASSLIIINDSYRNSPTSTIFDWLNKVDDSVLDRCHLLIATGAHDAPTVDQIKSILGGFYERLSDRTSYHDCRDRSQLAVVGKDSFGEEALVNKALLQHDAVIAIGSVEPHYFAGFTGGRKSIFPGLADFETIARNHNLANSLEAAPLKLKGNPVAEHLDSLMGLLDNSKLFGIQMVHDAKGVITGVCCGSLQDSFAKACSIAQEMYVNRTGTTYDAIIAQINPPLDRNLYQAQKALENNQKAVRDGGACLLVSPCNEGIGSSHFFELAANWNRETNRAVDGRTHFGSHKLSRVNDISRRIRPCLYSSLPPEQARQVFYEPIEDIQQFANELSTLAGARLAIVRDAANAVMELCD
jgi:nickel-dependent lactate racemase